MCCTVCAGDKAFRSPERDLTADEPLSASNIAEKLQNEFVIAIVDVVSNVVDGSQLTVVCRLT